MEQMGHLVLSRSVARISVHSCHRLVYKLSEHAVLAETNILDPSYQQNWHKLSPNMSWKVSTFPDSSSLGNSLSVPKSRTTDGDMVCRESLSVAKEKLKFRSVGQAGACRGLGLLLLQPCNPGSSGCCTCRASGYSCDLEVDVMFQDFSTMHWPAKSAYRGRSIPKRCIELKRYVTDS